MSVGRAAVEGGWTSLKTHFLKAFFEHIASRRQFVRVPTTILIRTRTPVYLSGGKSLKLTARPGPPSWSCGDTQTPPATTSRTRKTRQCRSPFHESVTSNYRRITRPLVAGSGLTLSRHPCRDTQTRSMACAVERRRRARRDSIGSRLINFAFSGFALFR